MLKKRNFTYSNIISINHFLITILFFLSLISTEVLAQSKAAKVIILRGSAQYTAKDGSKVPIKRGDWLPEGAIVTTEAKSFVKLLFVDKSSLNIAPKSSVTIAKFSKKKAGIINLLQGKIRSKVVKDYINAGDKGKKSKLFIKTKTAAMGVRGTDFSVETTGKVDTLNVVEGRVTVAQTTSTSFNTSTLDNILNTKGVSVPQGTKAKIPTSSAPITKAPIPKGELNQMKKNPDSMGKPSTEEKEEKKKEGDDKKKKKKGEKEEEGEDKKKKKKEEKEEEGEDKKKKKKKDEKEEGDDKKKKKVEKKEEKKEEKNKKKEEKKEGPEEKKPETKEEAPTEEAPAEEPPTEEAPNEEESGEETPGEEAPPKEESPGDETPGEKGTDEAPKLGSEEAPGNLTEDKPVDTPEMSGMERGPGPGGDPEMGGMDMGSGTGGAPEMGDLDMGSSPDSGPGEIGGMDMGGPKFRDLSSVGGLSQDSLSYSMDLSLESLDSVQTIPEEPPVGTEGPPGEKPTGPEGEKPVRPEPGQEGRKPSSEGAPMEKGPDGESPGGESPGGESPGDESPGDRDLGGKSMTDDMGDKPGMDDMGGPMIGMGEDMGMGMGEDMFLGEDMDDPLGTTGEDEYFVDPNKIVEDLLRDNERRREEQLKNEQDIIERLNRIKFIFTVDD